MTSVQATDERPTASGGRRIPIWLWLSLPIAVLAVTGSIIGIVREERIYGRETADWAGQSVGQDIANLLAFPLLVLFAMLAARGSLRAYLAWLGVLAYSAYTYTIYVFDIHFGPLFLLWVAVFGLSVYSLAGGLASINPARVQARFTGPAPVRAAASLLIVVGAAFALLWMSEIVPPMMDGTVPDVVREAGLRTNPVHVLDLALFLPAAILSGVLFSRRRSWGYVLAPVILVAMILLSIGIVSLTAVLAARGEPSSAGVGLGIGGLAAVELVVVFRLLRAVESRSELGVVVRDEDGG